MKFLEQISSLAYMINFCNVYITPVLFSPQVGYTFG